MRKNKAQTRVPVKLISTISIISLASLLIIGYIWSRLKTSGYFKVKEIILRQDNASEGPGRIDLSYLKGKNLFGLDLKREAQYLLEAFPNYSKIKLARILPDRLFVDFIKRKAVAYVKLYRYFLLDGEGVIFSAPNFPQGLELPVILGLETKIFGPKPGRKYNIKEVALALNIIKEARKNRILRIFKIRKIDVANPAEASFFIPLAVKAGDYTKAQGLSKIEDLEIKLGQDDIKGKITILGGLILAERQELAKIKYIDLRFKEPVIKFKNAKSK